MKSKYPLIIIALVCLSALYIYLYGEVAYGIEKGYTLENIELPSSKNQPKKLYDIHSKYILLEFWASWCPKCIKLNKEMTPIINEYSQYLKIIGISLDQDSLQWIKARNNHFSKEIIHYRDPFGWDSKYVNQFKFEELPFNILLNEEYVIIEKNVDANQLKKYIAP